MIAVTIAYRSSGAAARFDTPPSDEPGGVKEEESLVASRCRSLRALRAGDVHDDVAQGEEVLGGEVLREEVGQVVVASDEGDCEEEVFDALAHVEMAAFDVLSALVVLCPPIASVLTLVGIRALLKHSP